MPSRRAIYLKRWVSLFVLTDHDVQITDEMQAARAMALLTDDEQAEVLRYYFVKDAKLALGSRLIKRLAITRFCPQVAWAAANMTRDERTKPVFRLPDGSQPVLFNVSHQAGLVVLFGVAHPLPGTAVGVDVVCAGERRDRDHKMILKDGWPVYVDIHGDVMSHADVARLKNLGPVKPGSEKEMDRLLEYFYALWCLREAYVKMTGDALLASWLGELEMRYFAPPGQMGPEGNPLEVWFRGDKVQDVAVQLEPLLDEFMTCTVVRTRRGDEKGLEVGEFECLNLGDMLDSAEEATRR